MKTYTAQSGSAPQNIRILTDKVLIASDVKTLQIPDIGGKDEETEMYEYTVHEYSKDEYIGNWKEGKKDGVGIYKWNEGSVYVGEFKNNKIEGKGVCYNKDGFLIYEGEWRNNLVDGNGRYIWEDGKMYEGEFLQGKRSR